MVKKAVAAAMAMGLAICASSAYAADSVNIRMENRTDGEPVAIASDVQPEIRNNRVMAPLAQEHGFWTVISNTAV